MRRGLYRTIDSFLGECARVDESAGDAFPYLRRDIYTALGFTPPYDELPLRIDAPDGPQHRKVA